MTVKAPERGEFTSSVSPDRSEIGVGRVCGSAVIPGVGVLARESICSVVTWWICPSIIRLLTTRCVFGDLVIGLKWVARCGPQMSGAKAGPSSV